MNKLDELIEDYERGVENTKKHLSQATEAFIKSLKKDRALLDEEVALFADVIRLRELLEDEEYFIKDLKELKEEQQ